MSQGVRWVGDEIDPEAARIAQEAGERVEACIVAGDRQAARDAVSMAFEELEAMRRVANRQTSVADLFAPKIAAAMIASGFRTVGDVCQLSKEEISRRFQIRPHSAGLIEQTLNRRGFHLRNESVGDR